LLLTLYTFGFNALHKSHRYSENAFMRDLVGINYISLCSCCEDLIIDKIDGLDDLLLPRKPFGFLWLFLIEKICLGFLDLKIVRIVQNLYSSR